jgi:hypothetical protein
MHTGHVAALSLVVIQVVNQHSVGAFKRECHSPVAIDGNSPMALQII